MSNQERYGLIEGAKESPELKKLLWKAFTCLDGAIVLDKDLRFVYISDDYAKIMDVDIPSALGKRIDEVIDNTDIPAIVESGEDSRNAIYTRHGKTFLVNRFLIKENNQFAGLMAQASITDAHLERKELKLVYDKLLNTIDYYREKYERESVGFIGLDSIIAKSASIERIKESIKIIAPTKSSVLITGETGTGKEVFAGALHKLSDRADKPFIKLNCASIPETLMESELFGYESGSFTGALKTGKIGDFEAANGGTIFLDEVDSLSLNMQAKLLRCIQEKEIKKIGSTKPIKIDVRFIFATNKDLYQLVKEEKFRDDFYYRINVVHITLPPLRERKEDILPLANLFLKKNNEEMHRNVIRFHPLAINILESHDWPGNIRELENCVERAFNYSIGNVIMPSDIRFEGQKPFYTLDEKDSYKLKYIREEAEKTAIITALEKTGGNKKEAAELLDIDRTVLYDKINKYGIK